LTPQECLLKSRVIEKYLSCFLFSVEQAQDEETYRRNESKAQLLPLNELVVKGKSKDNLQQFTTAHPTKPFRFICLKSFLSEDNSPEMLLKKFSPGSLQHPFQSLAIAVVNILRENEIQLIFLETAFSLEIKTVFTVHGISFVRSVICLLHINFN
jgi:hypothetical protein